MVVGNRRERIVPGLRDALRGLLDGAFKYRRKRLEKALSLGVGRFDWKGVLLKAGVDPSARPDAVCPERWLAIAMAYRNLLDET